MCRAIGTLAVLITLALPAHGADDWLGAKVVLTGSAPLAVAGRIVEAGSPSGIYTVRDVRGEWLWLVSRSVSGWVQANHVVRLDKAVALFSGRIDKGEDARANLVRRATVWSSLGEDHKALADVAELMRLGSKDANIYVLRGIVRGRKQTDPAAIADFDTAIKFDPKSASAFHNRGVLWARQLQLDKAIADFTESIRLNPGYSRNYVCRGMAFGARPEPGKALADFEQAIRLNPYNAEAYHNRAVTLAFSPVQPMRDLSKALASATRACEITYWDEPDFISTLAEICAEREDYDKAVAWQKKAIALKPAGDETSQWTRQLDLYKEMQAYANRKKKNLRSAN